MTNQEMNAKVEQIRAIEAQAAVLKEAIDALKDELKAELDTRQVDSVDLGSHRVFYNCFEQTKVDTQKLKDAGLYSLYSKKSTQIQFRITDVAVI